MWNRRPPAIPLVPSWFPSVSGGSFWNSSVCFKMNHEHFLPHPFPFIIRKWPYHSAVNNLYYWMNVFKLTENLSVNKPKDSDSGIWTWVGLVCGLVTSHSSFALRYPAFPWNWNLWSWTLLEKLAVAQGRFIFPGSFFYNFYFPVSFYW
jgi:hypothetical protein